MNKGPENREHEVTEALYENILFYVAESRFFQENSSQTIFACNSLNSR